MNTHTKSKGLIFIISGVSGVGKDSICSCLLKKDTNLTFFVTVTTREKRTNEIDGVNYNFINKKTFMKYKDEGKFVEWVEYNGNYYGALHSEIEDLINQGLDVATTLTWEGAELMKNAWPSNVISFLIMPPSAKELEKRLNLRASETGESIDTTRSRIKNGLEDAKNWQKDGHIFTSPDLLDSNIKDYNHIIINDDLNTAILQIHRIIQMERNKLSEK